MPNQKLRRASELIEKDVNDRAGKDAGEIEDLVIDMSNGKVHYAVLDFDKAWSRDDKLMAMPLKAFTYPAETDNDLVLNVDRKQLDMKRGFDEDNWPNLDDPAYMKDTDRYLGTLNSRR